jgi:alpha-tubulin suppressor-like RCC1 family protein
MPPVKSIHVGRNHCFAVSGKNELYGWGSNRYNQIGISDSYSMIM